jgi:hypothetical protein
VRDNGVWAAFDRCADNPPAGGCLSDAPTKLKDALNCSDFSLEDFQINQASCEGDVIRSEDKAFINEVRANYKPSTPVLKLEIPGETRRLRALTAAQQKKLLLRLTKSQVAAPQFRFIYPLYVQKGGAANEIPDEDDPTDDGGPPEGRYNFREEGIGSPNDWVLELMRRCETGQNPC